MTYILNIRYNTYIVKSKIVKKTNTLKRRVIAGDKKYVLTAFTKNEAENREPQLHNKRGNIIIHIGGIWYYEKIIEFGSCT